MKMKAGDAPQARAALGDMARGIDQGGHVMALMSLPDGTDLCALLKGLPHDHCQCPHWGYVLAGRIRVSYQDGTTETVEAGDLYYWPPGHTLCRVQPVRGDLAGSRPRGLAAGDARRERRMRAAGTRP